MREPTNEDRAEWAHCALERFAQKTGQDNSGDLKHDKESVIKDLLCDLEHLADQYGVDFGKCVENAHGIYLEEVQEGRLA